MSSLRSDQVVIESPMSFTGSAKRIWKLTEVDNKVMKWALMAPIALALITGAFSVIVVWYLLFGIFLVPYRLLRRSQRKSKRDFLRHQELIEASKHK